MQQLREAPQGLRPEHQIHVAVGPAHPLCYLRPLGHAAAQADDLFVVGLFCVGQRAQIAVHPLFGVIPDGAGVQHHDIGLLGLVGKGAAHGLQHAHDELTVRHVLLAAEGVHHGPHFAAPLLVDGAYLIGKIPLTAQLLLRQNDLCSLQTVPPAVRRSAADATTRLLSSYYSIKSFV